MNRKKTKTTHIEDIIKISDSDEICKLMYNNISDLVLFLDTFGRIVHINKAGINFSGFTEEEVLGKFFLTLPGVFSKKHLKDYLTVFKKSLQGKPTKKFIILYEILLLSLISFIYMPRCKFPLMLLLQMILSLLLYRRIPDL